jgi:putative endonuclease
MRGSFCVYILASQRNGTLYIGHTDDIVRRMSQHQQNLIQGFTSKYGVKLLVYWEEHETRAGAFRRERAMKKWRRAWKLERIERFNPAWRDLTEDLLAVPIGPLSHLIPATAAGPN